MHANLISYMGGTSVKVSLNKLSKFCQHVWSDICWPKQNHYPHNLLDFVKRFVTSDKVKWE